ncbi:hypothetical protein D3C78_1945450 [compost metagenome]
MMAISSSVGLSSRGSSRPMIWSGISATVINQADTMEAATRNMITDVILAAVTNTAYS